MQVISQTLSLLKNSQNFLSENLKRNPKQNIFFFLKALKTNVLIPICLVHKITSMYFEKSIEKKSQILFASSWVWSVSVLWVSGSLSPQIACAYEACPLCLQLCWLGSAIIAWSTELNQANSASFSPVSYKWQDHVNLSLCAPPCAKKLRINPREGW